MDTVVEAAEGANVRTDEEVLAKFKGDQIVQLMATRAKALRLHPANKNPIIVSDLVTKEDGGYLQWIDLVMAGGGMLGIAHVGFVYVLEEAGIRFLGLGGTSAGAINAALIATVRNTPKDTSWEKTLKEMSKPGLFETFEDGAELFRWLRKALVPLLDPKDQHGDQNAHGTTLAGLLRQAASKSPAPIVLAIVAAYIVMLYLGLNMAAMPFHVRVSITFSILSILLFVVVELSNVWLKMGVHKGEVFADWMKSVMNASNTPGGSERNGQNDFTQNDLTQKLRMTGKNGVKLLLRHEMRVCLHKEGVKTSMPSNDTEPVASVIAMELKKDEKIHKRLEEEHSIVTLIEEDFDITKLVEGLRLQESPKSKLKYPLKLVTSEVGTQSKIVFPEHWPLFYEDEGKALPWDYVRASMSVPIFFQPWKKQIQPDVGVDRAVWERTRKDLWMDLCGYEGPIPSEAVFVDGGTLSNFPIELFHDKKKVPMAPVFGVLLGPDRNKWEKIDGPVKLLAAMNNSSRHLSDREFLLHNDDYKQLVTFVDTEGFNWLDFSMPLDDEKFKMGLLDQVKQGATAVIKLLEGFVDNKGSNFNIPLGKERIKKGQVALFRQGAIAAIEFLEGVTFERDTNGNIKIEGGKPKVVSKKPKSGEPKNGWLKTEGKWVEYKQLRKKRAALKKSGEEVS